MTVQKARELLGEDIVHLTDEQVAAMNNETAEMCSSLLKFYISRPVEKRYIDSQKH